MKQIITQTDITELSDPVEVNFGDMIQGQTQICVVGDRLIAVHVSTELTPYEKMTLPHQRVRE